MKPEPENRVKLVYRTVGKVTPGVNKRQCFCDGRRGAFVGVVNN
jgi:hypothetical protein